MKTVNAIDTFLDEKGKYKITIVKFSKHRCGCTAFSQSERKEMKTSVQNDMIQM